MNRAAPELQTKLNKRNVVKGSNVESGAQNSDILVGQEKVIISIVF